MKMLSATPAVLPKPPINAYVSKSSQPRFDGFTLLLAGNSLPPVLKRPRSEKPPSPKAEAGSSADWSRTPDTCGAGFGLAGLWPSWAAPADPAMPSESIAVVAMTALARRFALSSRTRGNAARPSGKPSRGAMTIVEDERGVL